MGQMQQMPIAYGMPWFMVLSLAGQAWLIGVAFVDGLAPAPADGWDDGDESIVLNSADALEQVGAAADVGDVLQVFGTADSAFVAVYGS